MRRYLPFLLLLASAMLDGPHAAQAQGFSVAGRVVDAATGRPLVRASVSIELSEGEAPSSAQQASHQAFHRGQDAVVVATTDRSGDFSFTGLAPGRYRLLATRRGYLASRLQEHGEFYAAVIVGNDHQEALHIRFPLTPLSSIRGMVLDSTGDPVLAATVTLFEQGPADGDAPRVRATTALQRGNATYEFDSLGPGTYYLAVNARPWYAQSSGEEGTSPLDLVYPMTFFDHAANASAAQPLVLRAGETAQANFLLAAVPAVHIQVKLAEGSGFRSPVITTPAFGSALPLGFGVVQNRSFRDGSATLSLSVAPGTYSLGNGAANTTLNVTADTTVEDGSQESGGVSVAGRLASSDGSPLPGGLSLALTAARDGAEHLYPQLSQRLAPPEGRRGGYRGFGVRPLQLKLQPDGSFSGDAIPPGDYRVDLRTTAATPEVITGSAASGATLTQDQTLHIGNEAVMLALTAAAASASVTGRVLHAGTQNTSGALVLLVPADQHVGNFQTLLRRGESDLDGTWTIADTVPGSYLAIALEDGWETPVKSQEDLERYRKAATPVQVLPSGLTRVEAPLALQRP